MTDIQSTLDELAKQNDNRTSVFEIEIHELKNSSLTLSGRVLNQAQVDDLHRLFPTHHLDTASIRILNAETHERVHVITNHTGLYEKPTFGMPLSSELYFNTELEVLDEHGNWVFTRQADGYLGWAYRPYLGEGSAPAASHLVLAPAIELRAEPNEASAVVTRLMSGTGVVVEETNADWSRVQANKPGWIQSSHLRALSDLPASLACAAEIALAPFVPLEALERRQHVVEPPSGIPGIAPGVETALVTACVGRQIGDR